MTALVAKRIGAKTLSLDASRASAVSCPREIADLIMEAANSAGLKVSAA